MRPARSLGVWFGILALVVQVLVSALPMQGHAATTGLDHDLTRICSTRHAVGSSKQAPQAPHGHAQCVVCAAVSLGASTMPPPTGVFIGRTQTALTEAIALGYDGVIPSIHHNAQQPRGPPATS